MALLPAGSAPVTLKPELLIAPMVFEPVGSAPAIEPTKTRPLESSCTAPICPLVKVGSVVLNAPPVSVAEVGAVAPVDPTEALLPPPPDCCNCAITGVNVSVLMSRSEEHTSELQSRQYLV